MSYLLTSAGYLIVASPEQADILLINTCGFIESAKREAINAILELAEYKQPKGNARFLMVAGCLAQRYAQQIRQDLPEVDAVLGTADYGRIVDAIRQMYQAALTDSIADCNWNIGAAGSIEHLKVARHPSTPGKYAYIKVAEGCSNCCAYCAIPQIRGAYKSRPIEELVAEADRLSRSGKDELILIAQDTSRYGLDLYGKRMLAALLKDICQLETVRMVRILYVYTDGLTDELIQYMSCEPKIAHYLDLPIQHAADRVLLKMNRRDSKDSLCQTISRLRSAMPDIVLRTTVLVGFPGETDKEYQQLLDFLQAIKFDHLGCFVFSPEEGTPAYSMRPRVSKKIAEQRQQDIMAMQSKISASLNQQRIGQVIPVTLESIDDSGIFYVGRSFREAPDVDPVIYVAGTTEPLVIGQTYAVRIIDAGDYDMTGVTEL